MVLTEGSTSCICMCVCCIMYVCHKFTFYNLSLFSAPPVMVTGHNGKHLAPSGLGSRLGP